MKKIFYSISLFILILLVGIYVSGNGHLIKGAKLVYLKGYKSAYIHDYVHFDTKELPASTNPRILPIKKSDFQLSKRISEVLDQTESVAFMVLHRDSILHESYYQGFTKDTLTNSFSMAKSVITLLTQIAIQEGKIGGWNQMVQSFLPELTGEFANQLQLKHLSTMTGGLQWDESYKNPFGVTAKAYYGNEVNELVLKQPIAKMPGLRYEYHSGETQLLGIALSRAVGKSISEYASEKLWQPLGMEHSARWHLDKANGNELTYCCLNATARDFAKLGLLVLNNGKYNGQQLVDSTFLYKARKPTFDERYGYSFWLNNSHGTHIAYYRGATGQYVIIIPEYKLVIVRLGYKTLPQSDGKHHDEFHVIVDEVLAEIKKLSTPEITM